MTDPVERFHYELTLLLGYGSKAALLDGIPASELPFWAALIDIKNDELKK